MGAEGEPVDDGGGEPGIGEGLTPFRGGRVGGDGDGGAFLALGQDLEEQFGPVAPVSATLATMVLSACSRMLLFVTTTSASFEALPDGAAPARRSPDGAQGPCLSSNRGP